MWRVADCEIRQLAAAVESLIDFDPIRNPRGEWPDNLDAALSLAERWECFQHAVAGNVAAEGGAARPPVETFTVRVTLAPSGKRIAAVVDGTQQSVTHAQARALKFLADRRGKIVRSGLDTDPEALKEVDRKALERLKAKGAPWSEVIVFPGGPGRDGYELK